MSEVATCRGCGKQLRGEPYYKGKPAYLDNGERAKVCFYGGFVCSEACDYRACSDLESTMPGHYGSKRLLPHTRRIINEKWSGANE